MSGIQKTLDAGLYEYGYTCAPLQEKWAPFLGGELKARKLIIAYNNSDYSFVSIGMFKDSAEPFAAGARAVCEAFEIKEVELYLPECACDETVKAAVALDIPGLTVVSGKVNVRETDETDLIHHPETILNIGLVESGKLPNITVKVKSGEAEKTVTVPLDFTMGNIISAAGLEAGEKDWIVAGGWFGKLLRGSNLAQPMYGFGNNIIEIFPEKFCTVSFAQKAAAHMAAETCGKCTICREGNYQIAQFLKNGVTGHGKEEDISWLKELVKAIGEESVCTFGQESVRFLKETMATQAKDYDAHIRGRRCDADVCQAFTEYAIDGSLCIGCGKCREICPAGAILDEPGFIHRIDVVECTKCGKCLEVCPEGAIRKVRVGRVIGPTKATKVGRFRSSRKQY